MNNRQRCRPLMVLIFLFSLGLTACLSIPQLSVTQSRAMAAAAETGSEEANKAVVQRIYDEVFTGKDLSVLAEIFDPNLVIHDFGEAAPNPDELIAGLPDLQATIESLVAEDDMVSAMVSFRGTHQGELLGVAPSGNEVAWTHIDLIRIQDGKIAEVWHNVPRADILKQLNEHAEVSEAAIPGIIGTWEMTIPGTANSPETDSTLQTFFADGNYLETNNNSQAGSMGHGNWIGSDTTYSYTFQVFTSDEEGNYTGKRIIHATIQMDSPDHYTGHGSADIIDLAGKVTKNAFSGDFEAIRLDVAMP